MRAIQCDRCGCLTIERGEQFRTAELESSDWVRDLTQAIRATIRFDPVNRPGHDYGGLDICKTCFEQTAREALRIFGGPPRSWESAPAARPEEEKFNSGGGDV